MTTLLGAVAAVVASVVAAAAIGLLWRRGDGVLRAGSGERIRPEEVELAPGAFGERGTLLLFTSQQDEAGPPLRRLLDELAAGTHGLRVAEVDLTAHGALAGRYAVTRTPTTFALDGDGRLRARVKGAAGREVLLGALARIAADEGRR